MAPPQYVDVKNAVKLGVFVPRGRQMKFGMSGLL